MSLHRSATRKAGSGPARERKNYSIAEQAMKQLYPPPDSQNIVPEIDIVLVPGLGAHPEESWKSESTKFNWTTEALVRDFPKSRVLLYKYQSAWTGALKVRQFMANIAMALLISLQSEREKCQRRPIVFIGHSMGGLVIAKAITIADQRRDKFPIMFEAIAAAAFFGTPFGGAPVASVAAMYAYAAEKIGLATSSKLLDLMKEGDEGLRELKHEFMRLVGKISPKIELFCFYEEKPTDFSKMAGLPALFGLTKSLIPKQYADFVSRDSATLPGVDELGLASNHRDLVKFDGPKDSRWSQFVRDPLRKLIHGAQLAVKNRLNSVRDIDRDMISKIMEALEGAQVQKKRHVLRQTFAPSSWITAEAEYTQWLAEGQTEQEAEQSRNRDCLWIRGPEGRGKTSASMAVVEEIETRIINKGEDADQGPVLLAYFFCDMTPDYNTAEDVLKSLIRQLINQQVTLAPYAKQYVKKAGNEGGKSQARVAVENLWQTLQEMLTDEFVGRKVIFVLNNVHCLPEDSDSTIKLMNYLNGEVQDLTNETKRVPTRWFITSREAHNVEQALKANGVRLVDLEDEKYGDQVQNALRKHAKEKISTLEQEKKYNKALAYFASSLIGRRAQNTQWIDITCVQLHELPPTHSDLPVRRALETMPQDLKSLLNKSWQQIFKLNEQEAEKIKEMLRALVLTYEDPSEAELGVLAGLCANEEEKTELHGLIEKCKPLLATKKDDKVGFMNTVVKSHLLENAKDLLGLSEEEIKWQHGVLTHRAFSHLKECYGKLTPEPPAEGENANNTTEQTPDQDGEENDAEHDGGDDAEDEDEDDDEDEDEEEEEEEEEEEDEYSDDDDLEGDYETTVIDYVALPYMTKNWLRHASKATLEIAEDLSLEADFWKSDSFIRRKWLEEYCELVPTFADFDQTTLTGLHVAASVGFRQLVAALIRNTEHAKSEIKIRDSLINTPLHFAANFGRSKIVEELLNRGAPIDDAIEIGEQTPLHMAAFGGHVEVMRKLVLRGANPNASANDIGPVVNAAICSGNRAAVELLVENGVSLTAYDDDEFAPLALAARLSDVSMFEYLIQKYADQLPAVEFSKALVGAAEAGKIEVLNKLLEFEHEVSFFQAALDIAVNEWNWDTVTILLQKHAGLNCNGLFLEAATCSEPQDKMLELAWEYANGSITAETLNDSLYEATDTEKDTTVELLLNKFQANPNATGEEYGNALTAAAYDGTKYIVEMLLDAGADVNAPEGYAIQAAATQGHYEVVQELLKRGADVNALTTNENFEEGTALQGATEAGQTEIVRLLLESGADPNHGSGECAPPIIAASRGAEVEILDLLVKAKPKIDVFGGPDMSTPLINAAAYMPVSSIEQLLAAGADINLTDNEGNTALIIASARGDDDAVKFLLENGADIMHSSPENGNALKAALDEENMDCLALLVDHVSTIFDALKKSMDSGNPVVTSVVRSATSNNQGLSYDDEPLNYAEANGNVGTSGTGSMHQPDINGNSSGVPGDRGANGLSSISGGRDSEGNERTEGAMEVSGSRNNYENAGEYDYGAAQNDSEGHDNDGDSNEERDRDTDDFQSEAATEVPTDDDTTDVASSINEDRSDAGDDAATQDGHDIPDAVTQLSEELQSALGNQISLFNQYHNREEESTNEAADSSWGMQGQHVAELSGRSSLVIPGEALPAPAELPAQSFIKRKPAPLASYEHGSQQSQTPSPKTVDTRYQAPPAVTDYDAHTPTAAYHPGQEATPHHYQQSGPAPASSSNGHGQQQVPPSLAPYQNTYGQTYQPSQPSQTSTAAMAGYPQQPAQYQTPSIYDGSQYGRPETHYAGQQQTYTAYHPNVYQPQQQQQQSTYSVEQMQAYQQAYDEKYKGYYASLQTAQQQQQLKQQQQQLQQQQLNGPEIWEAERPTLKPQRSSFFTGGVKNTFDKAKIVGTGLLNRKHTP
ncbi:ankyrin repeat-containing domain protein [Nemania sp. FL0031]|nr:ankyrin repeat-containing domain protein [Nemania sp. FL0031]